MNLANRITLGRFALSLALFVLMTFVHAVGTRGAIWLSVAMLLFIGIVATDALDGYYARKYHQTSDFGRIADPAVDKVVVCGTLVFLAGAEWARPVLAPWMVVLVITRELAISSLRGFIESRGVRFGADGAGKLKMIVQSVAIPAVFFFKIVEIALQGTQRFQWAIDGARWLAICTVWLSLYLTLHSAAGYVQKAMHILRAER